MNAKGMPYKILSVLAMASMLAACGINTKATDQAVVTPAAATSTATQASAASAASAVKSDAVKYEQNDTYSDWKSESPNYIELKGSSATLNGTGAALSGSQVMIMQAGTYVLNGSLEGEIIVDVQNKGVVRLVMNGVTINSSSGPAIQVKNAGKTVISLEEGTKNSVSDGKTYSQTGDDAPTAAIYSKSDLTLNGTGALTVTGNYKDGITSKDNLKIMSGTYSVQAKDDGIIGRDILAVKDGSITVQASGDGLKSTNDTDASKGIIVLQGGSYDIKADKDGIQSETSLLIAGGKYSIVTGGGSAKAAVKVENGPMGMGGPNAAPAAAGATASAATASTPSDSAKGIKAAKDITITGGTFTIDSKDDAVHSNDTLTFAGADMTITAGDDGVHADTSLLIQDGKLNITKSYEGVESKSVNIAGGEVRMISSDDGLNAGGGNDGSSVNGRPGQNNFSSTGSGNSIKITGGYISVDSKGDGVDANGSIEMSGGTLVVSGSTDNNNSALDYDSSFNLTGGLVVAAGSSGMAMAPSTQSAENSIMMTFSQGQKAGDLVTLKDSKDNVVAAFAPTKQYQTVVIASPQLKKGESYTLYTGGTAAGTVTDGYYKDATVQGGTKVVTFSISDSVTYVNESGVTTAPSGHGGMGGAGGMGGGGGGRMGGQMGARPGAAPAQ